ncbi:hypothetical protein BDQ12DRAFT_726442 [Crucibulum laeve]|uniref:Uncharacterized protein n=1 Tax=Crucibulum laeve TaxID=68775 RepID=A0A5C3LRK4_9AGAR|nr:hypothetical protein BDQ12DRAFT_726442 [Crucibulum laeve]
MLPNPGTDAPEQDLVMVTYKEMINRLTTRLSPITNLSIYYRTTSPGHPTCLLPPASTSIPYNTLLPHPNSTVAKQLKDPSLIPARLEVSLVPPHANAEEKCGWQKWDWDLFDRHNALWRDFVQWEKECWDAGTETSDAKWFFLDVWNQALQRQDAHAEPGADCLHWCLPSLPEQWICHLHHALFMEGKEKKNKK